MSSYQPKIINCPKRLTSIRLLLFAILLLSSSNSVFCQPEEFIRISGYIKDSRSTETLIGATIYSPELKIGTSTNVYGYYALKLPKTSSNLVLQFGFIGYDSVEKEILPNQDINLSIDLDPTTEVLEAFEVKENVNRQLIEENQMGAQKITSKSLKTIPLMFGEADVLKVVQLAPGVQPGSEGTSGFYVRGGGQDQNLILLDEAVVYNPEHFFGFFSTFNADIVKNLDIYKSDFPAKYGGRLSSVLDIQMRDGNNKEWKASGGIGLISSRLTVEGPLVKEKASVVLSARRTYLDLFTPSVNKALSEDQQIPNYYFYDLNAKINYILGPKDRIYLSGYFGRDKAKIDFGDDQGALANSDYFLQWGNMTGTLRWNHIFGPQLFANTSLVASRFNYREEFNFNDFYQFRSRTQTYNYSLKQDYDFYASSKHHLQFGALFTHYLIKPADFFAGTTNDDPSLEVSAVSAKQEYTGEEFGFYLLDNWKLSSRFSIKLGLRLSAFLTEDKSFYWNPEPRIAANWLLDEKTSIKLSYARMAQYLHQVKYSNLSFLDPWFPSTKEVIPELSDQVSVGFNRLLFNNKISLTNEYYYKWLHNQLEFQNSADYLFIDKNIHERLTNGKGWSYGAEWQLEKREGKTTGWISYTLSWSQRQFEDLNGGQTFPFTYDRRHVVNIVLQQQLPKSWTLSANWTYRTGEAIDLAIGRFFLYGVQFQDPEIVPVYTERNSFRMEPYHRLDVGAIKKFKSKKRFKSELAISIYNVYSRSNPFFIYYDEQVNEEAGSSKFVAKQQSLFPIIPSVAYNFSF